MCDTAQEHSTRKHNSAVLPQKQLIPLAAIARKWVGLMDVRGIPSVQNAGLQVQRAARHVTSEWEHKKEACDGLDWPPSLPIQTESRVQTHGKRIVVQAVQR